MDWQQHLCHHKSLQGPVAIHVWVKDMHQEFKSIRPTNQCRLVFMSYKRLGMEQRPVRGWGRFSWVSFFSLVAMFVSDFQMLIHNLARGMHHLYSYSLIVSYVFLVVISQELYQDQNSLLDQGMIKLMIFHECWTFPTSRWKQWWSSLIAFSENFQKLRKVSEGIGPKVKGCNGYLKIKSLFRLMMGLFNILQYIGTL